MKKVYESPIRQVVVIDDVIANDIGSGSVNSEDTLG